MGRRHQQSRLRTLIVASSSKQATVGLRFNFNRTILECVPTKSPSSELTEWASQLSLGNSWPQIASTLTTESETVRFSHHVCHFLCYMLLRAASLAPARFSSYSPRRTLIEVLGGLLSAPHHLFFGLFISHWEDEQSFLKTNQVSVFT